MRNKRTLWTCSLLCLASILPSTILAKPRSQQQKMQAAATALEKGALPGKIKAPGAPMKQLVANEEYTIYGYDHGGFAVIANDDLLPAVLGYSDTCYDEKTQNENFHWWLSAISEVAQAKVKAGKAASRVARPSAANFPDAVPMLLTTKWGQEAPFNNLCPIATDGTGRCLTGCAATSPPRCSTTTRAPSMAWAAAPSTTPTG